MNIVIVSAIVVGVIALLIGALLGIASEKFKVEIDENEVKIREVLPGNNCGGCGFAGCDALAKAIANDEAPVNACPVGGDTVGKMIAEILGKEVIESDPLVAFVKCKGTCDVAASQATYYGIKDCRTASVVPGHGNKSCRFSCLGYGSCVKVCDFNAIYIHDGIARVDETKCKACGKCVEICPNHVIELAPLHAKSKVQCNSNDRGPRVIKSCKAGCIGCLKCAKVCDANAIQVNDNLAHVDYSKCTGCGKCAEACPRKVIKMLED